MFRKFVIIKLFQLIFILIEFNHLFSEPLDTVYGGFRKCIQYSYEIKENKILKNNKAIQVICFYNKQGIEKERIIFYDKGNKFTKFLRQYNSHGKLVSDKYFDNFNFKSQEQYFYNDKNEVIEIIRDHKFRSELKKEVYFYDSSGNNTEIKYFLDDNNYYEVLKIDYNTKKLKSKDSLFSIINGKEYINEIQNYTYDEKDSLIEKSRLILQENVEVREKYIFDSIGRKIEYYWLRYKNDKLDSENTSKEIYIYDKSNKLIEFNKFFNGNNPSFKVIFKYDKKGNEVERVQYNEKNKIEFQYNIKYDRKGNIIEEIQYTENNHFKYKYVFSYDKFNNVITQKNFDESNKLIEYSEYKYSK